MKLFDIGKKIIKNPKMLRVTSVIYNFIYFNRIRGRRGNSIRNTGAYLKKTKVLIYGKNNEIVLGERCFLNRCTIQVHGNNNRIMIDNMSVLHSTSLYMEDDGGVIHVGERNLICGPCQLAVIEGTRIDIGKNCLFSSETEIRTGDSHSILNQSGERINQSRNVELGNHTWVGHRAMFLKGSKTGENVVVSTGAVVTKKYDEDNVVLAGVPAKIVKSGIDWCLERI